MEGKEETVKIELTRQNANDIANALYLQRWRLGQSLAIATMRGLNEDEEYRENEELFNRLCTLGKIIEGLF